MTATRLVVAGIAAIALAACGVATEQAPPVPSTFAGRIAALSGPGGYFDTDNLISNERSFLHVAPALADESLRGGAYLGVGPDQNFSYIAHTQPSIALLIDIRRDNLLLHLLFKAVFALSPTRDAYLATLTGRAPPAGVPASATIDEIAAVIDSSDRLGPEALAGLDARVSGVVRGFDVPLSEADYDTIRRLHHRFIAAGLSLQFNTAGRAPQWNYPTFRDLLLEVDRTGVRRSYLATDNAFQFVRSLHARDMIIPVVGDLSGETAVRAVARFLESENLAVSALYVSNVEFYLFGRSAFDRYVRNLSALPLRPGALLVRSAFTGWRPEPGYNSASMTQPIGEFLEGWAAGRFTRYSDLLVASR